MNKLLINTNITKQIKYIYTLFILVNISTQTHATDAAVFEKICNTKLKPAKITVKVDEMKITYDNDKSTEELKEMSGRSGTTLGLTLSKNIINISSESNIFKISETLACMRPIILVNIDLNPQKVYIGNEFKKGECAYKEITNHELKHVTVNQSHAFAVARNFGTELNKNFGKKIYFGHPNRLEFDFKQSIQRNWLPKLMDQIKDSANLHAKIDTKQESIRASLMCNKEVVRKLHDYKYDE